MKNPKVIIFCAVSLDGKIAKNDKDPIDWTGSEDKKLFARETKKAGVVIMGRKTFETISKPLKERLNIVLTRKPKKGFDQAGLLEFTRDDPKVILKKLERRGFKKIFVIGGAEIFTLFLKEGLAQEFWMVLVPKILGQGLSFTNGEPALELSLISSKRISKDLLFLKYLIN